MKKIIAMLLTIALMLSTGSSALGANNSKISKSYDTYKIDNGTYYSFQDEYGEKIWDVIIFVPNEGDEITFDTRAQGEDEIYSLVLEKSLYSTKSGDISSVVSTEYADAGFKDLSNADICYASDYVTLYEKPIEQEIMTKDSVQADLFSDMRTRHGTEYVRVVCTFNTYPNVESIEIHEDLIYHLYSDGDYYFSPGTTLSVIALALSGTASIIVSLVAVALSIASDVISTYRDGDLYNVVADFGRWGTVNGGTYMYTMTNKFISHRGVNELSNEVRAYIVDDGYTYYAPSYAYYHDYTAQADDVYDAYMG